MGLIKTTAVVSTICLRLKKRPKYILFRPILVVKLYYENTEKVTGQQTSIVVVKGVIAKMQRIICFCFGIL